VGRLKKCRLLPWFLLVEFIAKVLAGFRKGLDQKLPVSCNGYVTGGLSQGGLLAKVCFFVAVFGREIGACVIIG
jgi:hypothetical protein